MVEFNFCIVLNSGVRNSMHRRCSLSTSYNCGGRRGSVLWRSIAAWSCWNLPSQEKYFTPYAVNDIKLILSIAEIKEMLHFTIFYATFQHNGLWEVIHTFCFRHNVKKSVDLKFKITTITCRFHVFDV